MKEKEKLLDERITLRAEEYVCPATGETKVRTVEYIEKVIEKEVRVTSVERECTLRLSCRSPLYTSNAVYVCGFVYTLLSTVVTVCIAINALAL